MKNLIYLVCLILIISCSNAQQKNKVSNPSPTDSIVSVQEKSIPIEFDSISTGLNFEPRKDYNIEKTDIKKLRNSLSIKYLNSPSNGFSDKLLDSTGKVFTQLLLNNIIPHWYETIWDFNGHTSKPNKGTIACGYFVSTTLRDMGLNLNRYKLAQQGPENEAKSISGNATKIIRSSTEKINEELENFMDGVYFVGLDNHVGYLYKNGDHTYFIHSNYIDGKVMIENSKYSDAFYSGNYYISEITGNKRLIEKWLKNEEIKIITE